MTYMLLLNCALKLVEEIILFYDARSKKHQNEESLHGVKEERNILHTVNRRKANWIGHILRGNCLLKHVIGGRIEVTGRRARKHKQLLDYFKEKTGYRKLEEEALDRSV